MAKVCERCGSRNEDDMLFCTECGARLSEAAKSVVVRAEEIRCPACGASVSADDAFCTICGHLMKDTPPDYPIESNRPGLIIKTDPHPKKEEIPLDEHFHVPEEL